jgi:malate dehydrogenase (oxaloacetate-decarboxylating)(NADP+)
MEIAAVHAVAKLAQQEASDIVAQAYGIENLSFGREYLIPKPFDPRLISTIAPAVALAAQKSGVAARPISDYDAYVAQLNQFVYHSGSLMRPLFAAAKEVPMANKRIVFAEAEEEKVLRAIQVVIDEKLAWPILIGRPNVILQRIERFGLRMKPEADFDLVNPDFDDRYREYWQTYHQMTDRRGVTEHYAKLEMRRRHTLIGSMLVHKGVADGMLCGTFGHFSLHTTYIEQVLGFKPGATVYGAMNILQLPNRMLFLVDTHVNLDPTAEQLAELTVAAADEMKRLGIIAKAALISHSNFGTHNDASAVKMRRVLELVRRRAPWLEIDGEMHGDCAIDEAIRRTVMPNSTLKGDANLLILPDLSAANITYNLLKTAAGNNVAIGPVLLNASAAVHVLTPAATVRRIVNMTALTVVDANKRPEV